MAMFLFALFGAFLGYACCAAAGREDDRAETYWYSQKNEPHAQFRPHKGRFCGILSKNR